MTPENHITEVGGTGVPIPGDDIDQILPARFIKEVTFSKTKHYFVDPPQSRQKFLF